MACSRAAALAVLLLAALSGIGDAEYFSIVARQPLAPAQPQHLGAWNYFLLSNGNNILMVQRAGTTSHKVSPNFDTILNSWPTKANTVVEWTWAIKSNNDLVGIRWKGGSATELQTHTAASNYATVSQIVVSAFPVQPSIDSWFFLMRASNNDFIHINYRTGGSGMIEVHSLSAASSYQTYVLHSVTPFGPVATANKAWFVMRPNDDIAYIIMYSSRCDMHTLLASSSYTTFCCPQWIECGTAPQALEFIGWKTTSETLFNGRTYSKERLVAVQRAATAAETSFVYLI